MYRLLHQFVPVSAKSRSGLYKFVLKFDVFLKIWVLEKKKSISSSNRLDLKKKIRT